MFKPKRSVKSLMLLMVLLLLAACGQAEPQIIEVEKEVVVTQIVEKEVEVEVEKEVEVKVTEIVEVEKEVEVEVEVKVTEIVEVEVEKEVEVQVEVEVTAVPEEVQDAIYALYQEPQILNPLIATQTASGEVNSAIIEGLVSTNPSGQYYTQLATEVPSLENGGVVYDEANDVLTVSYSLQDGVVWSDGTPFTCDDVLFTWEAIVHPDSGAVSTAGYDQITSVECTDELTAVVTYSPFYAAYLELFDEIIPRHATGEPADMQKWPYNWHPIGTGPFKMTEWVPGDHITLVKNENYRDAPEKPYLDRVVVRITPSREVGIALIQSGEVDFLWDLIEAIVPELEGKPGVKVNIAPSPGTERLVLNMANPDLDATDDPLNNPHPLLGDVRVRQAMQSAINKDEINDVLLYGAATVGTKEYNIGWPSEGCDVPASTYDPDAASALLDEAGFTDEDGDGIRECNGCQFANAGDPLRLKIQTTTGNQLREQTEQLLIEYMGEVGIDMFIENEPSSVLFGSWASGAFRKHGQFDVLMYTTSGGVDPHSQMNGYFGADQMPLEANSGTGFNYSRWVNEEADAALKAAGATPDQAVRKELYCEAMQWIGEELPHIYLYDRGDIHATNEKLEGYEVHPWGNQTWNIGEWRWSE